MPNLDEAFDNLTKALIHDMEMGHTTFVITAASIIEYDLERSIKVKMRPLNETIKKRLFGDYGPISSFAAKIDLAYALDITTTDSAFSRAG